MLKGLYVLDAVSFPKIYGPQEQADIAQLVDIYAPPQTRETVTADPAVLEPAEVIFSGWGGPLLDAAFLAAAPNLRLVCYGAGSIRYMMSEAFWGRGVRITSAYAANAVPVAELTLAEIILSLKRVWPFARDIKRAGHYPQARSAPGAYGTTVGIISLGMVGRRVCRLLRNLEVHVLAYDPFVSPAAELLVELCPLDEVFRRSHVVSLHTPWLPETVGMITGAHLASMMPGATFINTARGAVVREEEMIRVLQERPDLFAVLDVTFPEPPVEGSPLYTLPNVLLTPHIAGSMDGECARQGRYMVEELRRYVAGDPLEWEITKEKAERLA